MAITNFISTVWSENLYKQLDGKYIGVANCNREWEGEIRQQGDRVRILGIEPISVQNYIKNANLSAPAVLKDNVRELVINQAKAFNFQIDDIDRAQSNLKIMNEALRNAANALAQQADYYVYSLYDDIPEANCVYAENVSEENIMDYILEGLLKLQENGVTDDIVLEVTPKIAQIIFKAKLAISTNNNETLENGCIGSIAGCKVYVSNNIFVEDDDVNLTHKCFMRTKRAIAFAEQLSEVEAYRPELRFADAVKGLMLYGAKIVYENEIALINFQHEI